MNIKETLESLGVRASKKRGQNFLYDVNAASKIVSFAKLKSASNVLEIGPGLGALTEHLVLKAGTLALLEIEPKFCGHLRKHFPTTTVIEGDLLKLSAGELLKEFKTKKFEIVSNAPYSISTDIILWIINSRMIVSKASLLFQRQFAERIAAKPSTKEYGSLSVLAQVYCECSLGPVFPGTIFHPKAEVESRLLEMLPREEPIVDVSDRAFFEKVVRACFSHRRKTILNSLGASTFDKDQAKLALEKSNISPSRRAETLELGEFAKLTKALVA